MMTELGTNRAMRVMMPVAARATSTPPMIRPLAMAWAGVTAPTIISAATAFMG